MAKDDAAVPRDGTPEAGYTAFVLALTWSGNVIAIPEWISARRPHSNDNGQS